MNENIIIRPATLDDAKQLLGIYAHYVENTSVSFEDRVPSVNEFRRRIETTLVNYPFLVAEYDEEIIGYAYANVFHSKYEYNNSAEVAVYIKKEYQGMSVGKTLYSMLEDELYERGVLTVYARVASTTKEEDMNLSNESKLFHEKCGYHLCGKFTSCAKKFNQWYNIVYYEKHLAC